MDKWDVSDRLTEFLNEDVGSGDITSAITPNIRVRAEILSTSNGYISGVEETHILFHLKDVAAKSHVNDGERVRRRQRIFTLNGMSRDILLVERTALNLLSRMSGITTLTRKYANALRKMRSNALIVATRKTTPGFRHFEKKAVVLGGGLPHRMGLYDMILLKDNHLAVFGKDVKKAVLAARGSKTKAKVEIEVFTVGEALSAAESQADMIMFDNMEPKEIRKAIRLMAKKGIRKGIILEASGGISLRNLRRYARTGVDWISTGRLTHSAEALDFTLEILPPT